MVTTRGRLLAAQSSATQEARENNVKQVPKKGKGHRTNRPRTREAITSTPSSNKIEVKRRRMDLQLTDTIGGASSGGIMNMPVEIFAELCSYLDPLDLRYLTLTNKMFRDVLMTKEARHIWKRALASDVDFPKCPTDLNEPQLVRLMFSSECYTLGCISQGIRVDCFYRIRLCKGCYEAKMTNVPGLYKVDKNLCGRSWFHSLTEYLDSWRVWSFPEARGLGLLSFSDSEKCFYFDEVKDVVEKYKALLQGSNAEERVAEYDEQLKDQSGYRASTGAALLRWYRVRRQARSERVTAKLENAGWNPIYFPFECQEFLDLVYGDQQLTPTIWQNIEPELVSLIQRRKDNRLE